MEKVARTADKIHSWREIRGHGTRLSHRGPRGSNLVPPAASRANFEARSPRKNWVEGCLRWLLGLPWGTGSSNPPPSSKESGANLPRCAHLHRRRVTVCHSEEFVLLPSDTTASSAAALGHLGAVHKRHTDIADVWHVLIGDHGPQPGHAIAKPFGHAAAMERKVCAAGAVRHQSPLATGTAATVSGSLPRRRLARRGSGDNGGRP
jgi:hypothetical protein